MRHQQILFSLAITALMASWSAAAAEDVAALIKRQSQEFSDASASGNAAVLDRYSG